MLDEDGDRLGSLTIAATITALAAGDDTVWGTTADAQNEPLLVHYRLRM